MLSVPDILAVFSPLLMAAVVGLGNRHVGDKAAQVLTCAGMVVALLASVFLFYDVAVLGHVRTMVLAPWVITEGMQVNWALRFDTLTVVMLLVVNGVSTMVHFYSCGYMSHDKSIPRFMAYLSLFTFFMLMLVTADNLLQLFFGWEGVGLASYLLINFWYHKESANDASMKAFLVNRVGDFGFLLGIFACFQLFGSIQFADIFAGAAQLADARFDFLGMELPALTTTCLLLFIGAMGKSAQLGLHTWLPDAMEGPTPVSALIHAATMVTAGVFMVARLSPMFEFAPFALQVVTIVGALTAIVAATIGMTQFDIKRVIAYSTMSQLGYMFFALGVSAYSAGIFHLMTHAFFKALLFLGAGSVIHALDGQQDMRYMGGIWRKIPATYVMMWVGSLALAGVGIPGLFGMAGFYSKDIILEAAFAHHTWFGTMAFWLGIVCAYLTALYSWRLLIMTFHGTPRMDHHTLEHAHESPWSMLGPLLPLAAGALLAGYVGYEFFVGHWRAEFWGEAIKVIDGQDAIENAHHVPTWVKWLPLVAALSGIATAYLFYERKPEWPAKVAKGAGVVYTLFINKYYFDQIYAAVFVRPAQFLGRFFWHTGDGKLIDAFGPDGVAGAVVRVAKKIGPLQTGYVYHYAFVMVLGVALLLTWFSVRG